MHGLDLCVSLTYIPSFPIWLWPQFIATFMVLGAALSNGYGTFTAFRSLQGLFGTIPQVVGLPIIHDMYRSEGALCIFLPLSLSLSHLTNLIK